MQRIFRMLDPYLGLLTLSRIAGDVIWSVTQGELWRGNASATVNRYLATIRKVLPMRSSFPIYSVRWRLD